MTVKTRLTSNIDSIKGLLDASQRGFVFFIKQFLKINLKNRARLVLCVAEKVHTLTLDDVIALSERKLQKTLRKYQI